MDWLGTTDFGFGWIWIASPFQEVVGGEITGAVVGIAVAVAAATTRAGVFSAGRRVGRRFCRVWARYSVQPRRARRGPGAIRLMSRKSLHQRETADQHHQPDDERQQDVCCSSPLAGRSSPVSVRDCPAGRHSHRLSYAAELSNASRYGVTSTLRNFP